MVLGQLDFHMQNKMTLLTKPDSSARLVLISEILKCEKLHVLKLMKYRYNLKLFAFLLCKRLHLHQPVGKAAKR